MNGWNIDTLRSAVNECTNPSGRVEDCAIFTPSLQTEAEQATCKIQDVPSTLKKDNCAGPAAGLCGNVPVQYGPEYAAPLKPADTAAPAAPTISSVAPVPVQSYAPARSKVTDKYGGGISVYNVKPTPAAAAPAKEEPAAAPVVTSAAKVEDATPTDTEGSIISTKTETIDGVVYEIAIKEVVKTTTVLERRKRHVHAHARREHGLGGRN